MDLSIIWGNKNILYILSRISEIFNMPWKTFFIKAIFLSTGSNKKNPGLRRGGGGQSLGGISPKN